MICYNLHTDFTLRVLAEPEMPPRADAFPLRIACGKEHYDCLSDEADFDGSCYIIPCSADTFSTPGELTACWEGADSTEHPAAFDGGRAFVGEPRTRRVAGDTGALWDRLSSLEAELAEKQAELAAAQTELTAAQTELTAAKTELEATQTELETAQTELEATQTELTAAQTELDLTREYTQTLEKQVDDLTAAHDRLASVVADMLPDLVAVCNDDTDVRFSFSRNRGNNNIGLDAVVRAPGGILTRDMLPEGMDTINLYSMKSCVYLNLTGFVRMACVPENPWGTEAKPELEGMLEEPIHAELLAGVTRMDSLKSLVSSHLAQTDVYGDWSAAPLSASALIWDVWAEPSTATSVPCRIDTSGSKSFNSLAVNAEKVRRWPDFDVSQAAPQNGMFASWDRECPPTLETHVRFIGIGTVRSTSSSSNAKTWGLELLRNWNPDDMRYSLVEASVYGDTVNHVALHPEAHARLSVEDRARITAKNLTLITRLYCWHS